MNIQTQIQKIQKALTPVKSIGKKIRIGAGNDGGYVVVEEALNASKHCLCFGAGGNIDVERQLAGQGKIVDCYDSSPDVGLLEELKDIPVGESKILANNLTYHMTHVTGTNLSSIVPDCPFFLKMDIEGGEWEVLRGMSSDNKKNMNMLVVEYHLNNEFYRSKNLMSVIDVLLGILGTHHLVHIHGNNYDIPNYGGTGVPAVVECCYLNKNLNLSTNEIDFSDYPTVLDTPNNSTVADYPLDWWKKSV
jgi:hypothetical protein